MSNSLWPHELQHARFPWPLLSPWVWSYSCPLNWWCYLTISLSPPSTFAFNFPQYQDLLHESALLIRWPKGWSFSSKVLPKNIQGLFPLELTGLMSLQSRVLSRVFSSITIQKHQFFSTQPSLGSNSHIHTWLLKKTIALTIRTFVGEVMFLLLNMVTRFVTVFLPRSKHLLISWLQSPMQSCTHDFRAQENKICHYFHFSPFYLPLSDGTGCHGLSFLILSFKPSFSLSSFTFIKRLFSFLSLSAIRVVSSEDLRLLIFLLVVDISSWFQLVIHPDWHFPWCNLHRS